MILKIPTNLILQKKYIRLFCWNVTLIFFITDTIHECWLYINASYLPYTTRWFHLYTCNVMRVIYLTPQDGSTSTLALESECYRNIIGITNETTLHLTPGGSYSFHSQLNSLRSILRSCHSALTLYQSNNYIANSPMPGTHLLRGEKSAI